MPAKVDTAPLSARLSAAMVLACRLMRERHAVAAVEFALILPVALILYLGTVETYRLLSAQRKITLAAHAMADLVTRQTQLSQRKMVPIWMAGPTVSGFDYGAFKAYVSSVTITPDPTGSTNANIPSPDHEATVCWSKRFGPIEQLRHRGDVLGLDVIPGNLRLPRTSLILVEIEMPFKSITNFFPLDSTLTAKIMMRPRTRVFLPYVGNGDVNNGMPTPQTGPCLADS
jgi:hypothetical protein